MCARKGWDVVGVYPDNDVSAYSGAPRPQWQDLLADVRAGRVDAVVCWHVDRLTRSRRELEDVIDLADRYGLDLATVSGEISPAVDPDQRNRLGSELGNQSGQKRRFPGPDRADHEPVGLPAGETRRPSCRTITPTV